MPISAKNLYTSLVQYIYYKDKMVQKDIKAKLKKLYGVHYATLKYLAQFLSVVIIYGFLIAFSLTVLLSTAFNIKSILAYGVVAYIVKAELPMIISSCFPKQPPNIQA